MYQGQRNQSGRSSFGRTIILKVNLKFQFYKKQAIIKSASMIFRLVRLTVWHENFTWNLILRFYGSGKTIKLKSVNQMQIQYISLQDREQNWGSVKLKSQQLFIQTIERRTVKFNYRKVFIPYGIILRYNRQKKLMNRWKIISSPGFTILVLL